MSSPNVAKTILALDVGEKRIGVAKADTQIKFPFTLGTIEVNDSVHDTIGRLVDEERPQTIVVGYPRNQSGEITEQTRRVEQFARCLEVFGVPVVFQDESLTSVLAEQHLKATKKTYTKADIDAHAAVIILSDYLESNYA